MCRLFGLIANKEVDIKFSILEAKNHFKKQGKNNPHGWGIGYYKNSEPKVEKYGESAFDSNKFDELVKEIKSKIFIAHVRYASSGSPHCDRKAHPFVYKNWIFAHNGTIDKERTLKLLIPPYNQNFTSEPIDSEVYFRFLIQCIEKGNDVSKGVCSVAKEVTKNATGANFVLSDGRILCAFRYGKDLYYLRREPASLTMTSKETQALIGSKTLLKEKAFLISTEKLTENESWKEIENGRLLIIDENLHIREVTICQ